MQNNSAEDALASANKEEKPSLVKSLVAQMQKKTVEKVVKNPLMAKKNPLLKSQVPAIKQTQTKLIIQHTLVKNSQQASIRQEEAKPIAQKKIEDKKEAIIEVKSQKPIEQQKLEVKKQHQQKPLLQIKQPKQQNTVQEVKQKKQNPLFKKNPLLISQPKVVNVKQPQIKASVIQIKQKKQEEVKPEQVTVKIQEKKSQKQQQKDQEAALKQELVKTENKTLIIQNKNIQDGQKCQVPKEEKIQKKDIQDNKPKQKQLKSSQKKVQVVAKSQAIAGLQKSIPNKQEPKTKESKIQPQKKTDPLSMKRNPLLKSQMIFKPSQTKQPTFPTPQKKVEEPKLKQENPKPQESVQKKIEKVSKIQQLKPSLKGSIQQQKKIEQKVKQQKKSEQKAKQQRKIEQKLEQKSFITQQQTTSNSKFQNTRFSLGFFSEPKVQQNLSKNQVEVKITDSFQKGTALSKYIVYQIQGKDKLGSFHILRKFSQFQAIRQIIRERWPGCFIPAIHNKSQLKKNELKEKQIRMVLQNFILGLSYSPHLFYKEEVQLFLRSPETDVLQMVKQMPVLKARDVINRYNSCFGDQTFQNIDELQISAQIKDFTVILRKIAASLNSISEKVQFLSESYDKYVTSLAKFGQISKAYQQVCLAQYTNNSRDCAIIIKDQSNSISKLNDLWKLNPFIKLYSFIKNQARDAESFVEIIIASQLFALRRDQLIEQISNIQIEIKEIEIGHKTLKTMTSLKPKEQIQIELQAKIRKLTQQKENIIKIHTITEVVLAKKEIEIFKSFKRNSYRDVLRQWASLTKQMNPQLQELWKFIQDSSQRALK